MKTTKIRVLEQDLKTDEIRIGASMETEDTARGMSDIENQILIAYSNKLDWCGGYHKGTRTYYKRIAMVNADTLKVIKVIFEQ